MNIWDILILSGVALMLYGAVRLFRGRRRKGCGCGCEGCAMPCARAKK